MTTLAFVATFMAMEAVTYCAHRWVMHGFAWMLHRSHHRRLATRFEANDVFPLVFSGIGLVLFATAMQWDPLWPIYWGVLAYGAAYLFVHDLYIHQRAWVPRRLLGFLAPLREAHMLHHRFNGEPYGMLFPVVPKSLKARAARHRAATANLRQ